MCDVNVLQYILLVMMRNNMCLERGCFRFGGMLLQC